MNGKADKSGSSGIWRWLLVGLLGALLVLSVMMNILLMGAVAVSGSSRRAGKGEGEDEFPRLREKVSFGSGRVKAVHIVIRGMIVRERGEGFLAPEYDRTESILRQIRAAANDEDVLAIILDVDSPGGAISPTDEIYRQLERFKTSAPGRRVVVLMRDVAASGGYFISMAGDWLIAEPTAVVGSIGVILQSLNWTELSDRIGVHDTTIKSGRYKDLLNPFRKPQDEELEMLQGVVDGLYEYFLGVVSNGRHIAPEELRPLADGRVFSAIQAKEKGLIDEIGYWDDAMRRTKELLGVEHLKVVRYESATGLAGWLARLEGSLQLRLPAGGVPRLMYLWKI